jgi:serine/threonine protein kinase/Flp pilus assembly protein TadD
MTAATPSAASHPDLADRLAEEMATAWRRGERLPAEHYLERHPGLLADSDGPVRLIYEEVCLRQERGEEVQADELVRRFPRWTAELAALLDCHRLMQGRLSLPEFPAVGQSLGDFRLVAELGRGAQGRVYLATQAALADRPVVLKVTPRRAREHLVLARLQHTHIIPLHAAYDFPGQSLRALCMPFLGGATLARVLDVLRDEPPARRTGQSLLAALDTAQADVPLRLPGRGGYRPAFAALSYVEAVCRVGACLADGLHHAHERGLVHLDLKPSNVLLAADAQALLLDFHLARHPLRAGQTAPEGFGGTPGYMPPEQEAACAAARRGGAIAVDVDARADVYALGRLMYIALGGGDAITDELHRLNPQVSVGLSDVVRRCLAPAPADRYPDAASLATDLRRHLAQLPLRGVANRSLRERWRKWRRRRPNAALWGGLLLALVAAGAMLATAAVERYGDARAALAEGREQARRGAYGEAVKTLARGKSRASGLPGTGELLALLDAESRLARRAQAAEELHAVAERLRFLAGADLLSTAELRQLAARCRTAWDTRSLLTEGATTPPGGDGEEQVRADLRDLALLWSDLRRELARRGEAGDEGEDVAAAPDAPPDPRDARTHVARGRSLLGSGDLAGAAEELTRAADLRPQDFWAHFYLGVCAYRRREYADAVHSFGVAVALAPASAECYYNRALAYAAAGNTDRALADYDRALALAPHLAAAALNRGVLHYQEGRFAEARSDLGRALRDGAEPAAVHYNIALVCLAQHDRAAAREHLEQALSQDPGHVEARALRDRLSGQKPGGR